jgi:hypothetical protein
LKAEVADLMAKAEAADQADIPDGLSADSITSRTDTKKAAIRGRSCNTRLSVVAPCAEQTVDHLANSVPTSQVLAQL